ncbi:hypothetical protein DO97_07105 [Neosynechococcus sphagnicola sy1]|uniref:Putative restriction endonuclease domain-containing protein n=1 Tax=Neosynechococcus sphagnicola sy1 TaxID=1497020 RepID=A0A098TJY9_9CYAN|nr:Uma2 family endonuclease [Neosynechococcus sphagnicola]KGF72619.1 hypothetical protein DO97_07105 [Neosynechococcus sphagnicola sy1]
MVPTLAQPLTLQEFLALPEGDVIYEFVDGQAVPKLSDPDMSPKYFHSSVTGILFVLLHQWSQGRGRTRIEWAVSLVRQEQAWVPVPDLTYISYDRLPLTWGEDAPCPVPPELTIEIISPGQTFGAMLEKVTHYLLAGILRAWVVDTQAHSITVFFPDQLPRTYTGNTSLSDPLLEGLKLTAREVFQDLQ